MKDIENSNPINRINITELQKIVGALIMPLHKLVAQTIYMAGLRLGELASLLEKEVDLENKVILVKGKGECREVSIGDELQELLAGYQSQKGQASPSDQFFIYESGKGLKLNWFSRDMEQASKKLGFGKRITSQTLRHSFANNLGNSGVNSSVVWHRLYGRVVEDWARGTLPWKITDGKDAFETPDL